MVQMATLEELLTGRTFEDVMASADAEGNGGVVAMRGDGGPWVAKLSDALTDALAESSSTTLARVAETWGATEEFWGQADPQMLHSFLEELSTLARRARADQAGGVYCWLSL